MICQMGVLFGSPGTTPFDAHLLPSTPLISRPYTNPMSANQPFLKSDHAMLILRQLGQELAHCSSQLAWTFRLSR